MEQPIPKFEPFERADELLAALGVERSELPVRCTTTACTYTWRYPARTPSRCSTPISPRSHGSAFRRELLRRRGRALEDADVRAGRGVAEDPATGSAAGPLAVHLARHGWIEYGRPIQIRRARRSAAPRRSLRRADGGGGLIDRVEVGGSAVVVARGEFRL